MSRVRRIVFTWNNYPEDAIDQLKRLTQIQYYCVGRETSPSTGTPHLQGYAELDAPYRLSSIFTWITGWHVEACKGNQQQNLDYVRKEGNWESWGTLKQQGKRSDIHDMVDAIKSNKTFEEVLEAAPTALVRYPRAYNMIKFNFDRNRAQAERDIEVVVFYGGAGTGKTRSATRLAPNAFLKHAGISLKWWDGYTGEEELIIDDFDGSCAPYRQLLNLLDRYKLQLEVKGGFTWALWKKVYITSNIHPKEWYPGQDYEPIRRRIKRIVRYSTLYALGTRTEEVDADTTSDMTTDTVMAQK
jgi:hypothetical protein